MQAVLPISSLLAGMGILLTGSGLLGTVLGLRAAHEGYADATVGIVMSGFFIGYIAGVKLCPPIIHRVGHIRSFAALAALFAALGLLYGLVVDPIAWFVLRLLNGITLIGIYMVIESWINERGSEGRAAVFGAYMMVSLFGLALGQTLVPLYGPTGLGSFAVVGVLVCLGLIPIALTRVVQPTPIETAALPLGRLRRVAPVGFGGALASGLVIGAFWGLAPLYATALEFTPTQVANFMIAAIVGGAVLQWPIGRLSDRMDRRQVLFWVCVIGAVSTVAMMLVVRLGTAWVIGLAFLFGGFLFAIYGLAVAQTHDRFDRSEALEATKALLLAHGIGASAGPLLTGWAMELLGTRAFPAVVATVLLGLAVYVLHRLRVDAPVPAAERTTFMAMSRLSPAAMDLDPRAPDPGELSDLQAAAQDPATAAPAEELMGPAASETDLRR